MQIYTKAILALAGVLIPALNQLGVTLPEFLTVDWLNGLLLLLTPPLVFFFPNRDSLGNNVGANARSPAIVGLIALAMASLLMAGCVGTKSAYQAAEGLEETAYVMNAHYLALVNEGNRLRSNGALSGAALTKAQRLVTDSRPLLRELSKAAQSYGAIQSAENEADLSAAIAAAAVVLSDLVNAIRSAGGRAHVLPPWQNDTLLSRRSIIA